MSRLCFSPSRSLEVFPELREWCEARGLSLVECDLRWGVPKDSPSTTVIATCLEELDRCQQDTYGKPLMLVLIGNRVGWVPAAEDISLEIVEQYRWVPGMSVTGMEIVHGAYRNCNPNVLFCFRDPSIIEMLPTDMLKRFQDGTQRSQDFLNALKKNVGSRFPKEQMLLYQCQVKGTDDSSGLQKVQLEGLEHFSSAVLQFLEKRISQTFPGYEELLAQRGDQNQPTWQQVEEAQHRLYLQQKSQLVLGREQELDAMLAFLQAAPQELLARQEFWRQSIREEPEDGQVDCKASVTLHSSETQKNDNGTNSPDTSKVKDGTREPLDSDTSELQVNDGTKDPSDPDSSRSQKEEGTDGHSNTDAAKQGVTKDLTEAKGVNGTNRLQDLKSSDAWSQGIQASHDSETIISQKGGRESERSSVPRVFPFVVSAQPGMGKSALMAMCTSEALKLPNLSVFFHFVGCSPSSVELQNLVQRLCCYLIPDKQGNDHHASLAKGRAVYLCKTQNITVIGFPASIREGPRPGVFRGYYISRHGPIS
ncbi:uncharacterized protein [Ambystoma mexicanum]|uniref:uncharacterized protein n=1 Tax=Ambystoma mexicanum TaxID=8296 RepID=UPI0037E81654